MVNRGGRHETVTVPVEMPQGVTHEGVFGEAGTVAYGGIAGQAPTATLVRASRTREVAAAGHAGSEDRAPVLEELAVTEARTSRSLSQRARERLAPELRALFEGASASPRVEQRDGRVRVRVVLEAASAELVRRLEASGLDVRKRADGWLDGWIRVDDLAALAAQDGVGRVELP